MRPHRLRAASLLSAEPVVVPVARAALEAAVPAPLGLARSTGALISTVLPSRWGHRSELARGQIARHTRFCDRATLSPRLLDMVRLWITSVDACEVCQTSPRSCHVSEPGVACLGADESRFSVAERAVPNYEANIEELRFAFR